MQIITCRKKYFHFLHCYYVFPLGEIFNWIIFCWTYFFLKYFTINYILNFLYIIYRRFKMQLIVKYFRKNMLLISSPLPPLPPKKKTLLIITWYRHIFMFAFLWTMYLFKTKLNLLPNTSTPDVAQYHFIVGLMILSREKYPCNNIPVWRCMPTNA